ncbi:IclR family transcriptional regulator [Gellertiella hungarica]|uniref:DNA-binding IclR family transcriptional regulator n=1 Tax=Gellertiella hungarica TaxID=1572859 RepID=A0A7W6NLI1_9HYPH|nr:IclR family transcriptional regulator [Gellertiella hungarica]MBB4065978.1 DNA-binding IclR family transcriptional regulator [Gellertiella hungarica]
MDEDESQRLRLVPAVERASVILDIVSASKRYLTVSDLARETALPKSTVHGLCTTLVHLGLLIRRPDQTFVLGPHLLKWSNAFDRQTDIAAEFAALWDQSGAFHDAVVSLCILDEPDVVFIAARQTSALERFPVKPGMRLPAAFCAAGKAMLARLPDHELQRAYRTFPAPLTERSVENLEVLLEEVRTIRAEGIAIDVGQCQRGVTNFAAAVRNSLNRTVAAVLVSVGSEELAAGEIDGFRTGARELADRLSLRLGAEPA